ncbi:peptidase S8 [Kitasatospora cystarginea]|uniref:Peptidase S8 n=1 Tax=Kitasatospora cystarginea TaxID=58350 RepID=A0ABP5RS92_9ACTN
MHGLRPIRSLLATALVLVGLAAAPAAAQAHASPTGQTPPTAERVCSQPADPLQAACGAMIRTDVKPLTSLRPGATPAGLSPLDISRAYNLSGRHGDGRTVAITVAFHHPNLESDLAVYRRQFHLPPCTTASGCLRVINQRGGTTLPAAVAPSWSLEEALDVDAVSAACPDCRILVVETDDNYLSNLLAGVDQAVAQGAKFVSNSWLLREVPFETAFDFHFSRNPGVVFAFASGDAGGVPVYPSSSPYVTSVGGTSLLPAHNQRGFVESAWRGTGCGCSAFEPKPAFQHDSICPNSRTTADASAVADPATGLAVYTTTPALGWAVVGGTSLSTPLMAGMYALAGKPAPGTFPNTYPYAHPQDFHDITTGMAGAFSAVPGYDAPTGIGTPDGVRGLQDPIGRWNSTAGASS